MLSANAMAVILFHAVQRRWNSFPITHLIDVFCRMRYRHRILINRYLQSASITSSANEHAIRCRCSVCHIVTPHAFASFFNYQSSRNDPEPDL